MNGFYILLRDNRYKPSNAREHAWGAPPSNKDIKMIKAELAYKPLGIGKWTTVTISRDMALALAKEYAESGWPVMVDGIKFERLESPLDCPVEVINCLDFLFFPCE